MTENRPFILQKLLAIWKEFVTIEKENEHKIVHIHAEEDHASIYRISQSILGELLQNIALDKTFVRGEDCYLYDKSGNCYLDCIAAFMERCPSGITPRRSGEAWPISASRRSQTRAAFMPRRRRTLARRLVELAPPGLRYVTFTNSGAGSGGYAALKLCRPPRGAMGFWRQRTVSTARPSVHSLRHRKPAYQVFRGPREGFDFVRYGDLAALEEKLPQLRKPYAAFIVEPIQGEGGLSCRRPATLPGPRRSAPATGFFWRRMRSRRAWGGRAVFLLRRRGGYPDLLLLAKALGGGLMPIGACLSTAEAHNDLFALKHSS